MIKRIVQYIIALSCVVAIGQIPITGLPPATLPLTGNEQVPMVQNNNTVQAKVNSIVPPSLSSAPFVMQAATPSLAQSRTLAPGTGITIADGGPGSTLTINAVPPTLGQIVGLWTPPCNTGSLYLAGNGTCSNPSTPPGAPTGSVQYNNGGVFGGSSTFTFVPSPSTFGTSLTLQGTAANTTTFMIDDTGKTNTGTHYAESIRGSVPNGNAGGLEIRVGTSGGDIPLWISDANNSNVFFNITGQGSGFLGSANNFGGLTWNGINAFTFGAASGIDTVTIGSSNSNGAGHWAETVKGATGTSGNSYGLQVQAGSAFNDQAFLVRAATGSPPNLFQINGDGSGSLVSSTVPQLTWDNNATFQSTSNSTTRPNFQITSPANQNGIYIQGNNTVGASYGMGILAGTNLNDIALNVANAAGTSIFERLYGDGHGGIGPSVLSPVGMTWNSAGQFLISPPTGIGASLEVDGYAGSTAAFAVKPGLGGNGIFVIGAGSPTTNQLVVVNLSGGNTIETLNNDGSGCIGRNCLTDALQWNTTGNFTMQGATSGPEFTINSPSGQFGEIINGNVTANASNGLQIFAGTSTSDSALAVYNQANTNQFMDIYGNGSGFLGPTTSHNLSWNGNGAFTVNAPTSGMPLTVNGNGTGTIGLQTTAGVSPLLSWNQTGQTSWQALQDGTLNNFRIWNANSGTTMSFTNTGNVTIPAPTTGDGLTSSGFAGSYGVTVTSAAATLAGVKLSQTSQNAIAMYNPASTNTLNLFANGADREIIGNGVQVGAPTGGDEGAGTVNAATGYYINGTPVALGGVILVTDTTTETRTSTTTPTNSTQLQVALTAGTYKFEFVVPVQQAAAGTVGISCNVNYSGTITSSMMYWLTAATSGSVFNGDTVVASVSTVGFAASPMNTFQMPVVAHGIITVSTSGTLAFAFAQNTSSATAIEILPLANAPATITVERIR